MTREPDTRLFNSMLAFLLLGIASCGGGSSGALPTFVISPWAVDVLQGGTQQFTATASGASWSVQEGGAGGSITSNGLYTAPVTAGTFHVMATGQGQTRTATVHVPPITIVADRGALTAATGESVPLGQFIHVHGTVNTGISWTITEGAAGGSITPAGIYTAPNSSGTYHVVANSQANSAVSTTVTINVGALAVTIAPTHDTLGAAGVRTFFASVTAFDTRVNWSVLEGNSGGTMHVNRYTAPNTTGTYHVVASSVRDASVSATASVTVISGGFRPTTTVVVPRWAHTATLLQNGRVLIAGGETDCGWYYYYEDCATVAAELYDAATGLFSQTGNMRVTRVFHTATLLPDGRVLIAGGGTASAELYDPATGTFTATGSMSVVRTLHSATLLLNGRVLVTGGFGIAASHTTAEIYDPQTGTFSPTSSGMTVARASHSATRLPGGRVLVAGGDSSLRTAELFDPATSMFTATGGMSEARSDHRATLLDNGTVLITGGTLNSAEIFDATIGGFNSTGSMLAARHSHTAVLLQGGRVLVSGGDASVPDELAFTAEVFNPTTGVFTQTGSMAAGRRLSAAVLLSDGRVLVTGGSGDSFADIYQ